MKAMRQLSNVNYAKELEGIVTALDHRPRLLLHSCCAPCSSYCLIYLLPHFDITCFYYNPNITEEEEYNKRVSELERLVSAINLEYDLEGTDHPVKVIRGGYDPERFIGEVCRRQLEEAPEGGARCELCFNMRLMETYREAVSQGFEYFTTTLTISPLKNAQLINQTGLRISEAGDGTKWLPSDFKKNDGYRQSIELSRKYDLYRQNYCGCVYSKRN